MWELRGTAVIYRVHSDDLEQYSGKRMWPDKSRRKMNRAWMVILSTEMNDRMKQIARQEAGKIKGRVGSCVGSKEYEVQDWHCEQWERWEGEMVDSIATRQGRAWYVIVLAALSWEAWHFATLGAMVPRMMWVCTSYDTFLAPDTRSALSIYLQSIQRQWQWSVWWPHHEMWTPDVKPHPSFHNSPNISLHEKKANANNTLR